MQNDIGQVYNVFSSQRTSSFSLEVLVIRCVHRMNHIDRTRSLRSNNNFMRYIEFRDLQINCAYLFICFAAQFLYIYLFVINNACIGSQMKYIIIYYNLRVNRKNSRTLTLLWYPSLFIFLFFFCKLWLFHIKKFMRYLIKLRLQLQF